MNIKSLAPVLFVALTLISVSVVAQTPTASPEAPEIDREQQLRDHLERLDRTLRQRLRTFAERDATSNSTAGVSEEAEVSEEETNRLKRHLRSLESQIHGWESGDGAAYLDKTRGLRHLVENLARAAQAPPGKVAGLAELKRALKVEWPPSLQLKVVVGDDCADAQPIGDGTYFGDTSDATRDGDSSCGGGGGADVWFAYSSPTTKNVIADTFGSGYDTLLSVHTGCPGTFNNEIACNDDTFGLQSAVAFQAQAGTQYLIRVSGCCGNPGSTGPFVLNVGPGGAIAGTVRDAVTGSPIPSVEIAADADGYFAGQAQSGASGDYLLPGLLTTEHKVYTTDPQGYLPEIYDDVPCFRSYCEVSTGTAIPIQPGTTAQNIDFALNVGGTVAGTVTESATGSPIPNLEVRIWNSLGERVDSTYTDAQGHYSLAGLYAGTHYASTRGGEYRDELFNGIPCLESGCGNLDPTTGSSIAISYGATTGGIDFALEKLGVIAGQVVETLNGFPISGTDVEVVRANGDRVGYGFADATGFYRAGGLPPGTYFVKTADHSDFFDELYDDLPCEPTCDPAIGEPIMVGLDETVEDIDFALDRLGLISGTVTDRLTGEPVPDAYVQAGFNINSPGAGTNSSGNYLIERLVPGSYSVTAEHHLYRDELYDDIPCQDGCDPGDATPVPVQINSLTTDIDFALERLGSIAGTVTHRPTGAAIEFAHVEVFDTSGSYQGSTYSDSSGDYTFEGLTAGTYYAVVRSQIFSDERYDNLPCSETDCDPTAGTPIAVSLNTVTGGIGFALEQLGMITGAVTDASSGATVEYPYIEVYDAAGSRVAIANGEFNGEYTAIGLAPGSYFVFASNGFHRPELYDDLPCLETCDPTTGTPVAANLNVVTAGIDFALDPLGSITGTVTQTATGSPVANARVSIRSSTGSFATAQYTDVNGFYRARGLLPGTYFAIIYDNRFGDELYDGIPCETGCDPTTGTPITVNLATTTPGIDFTLSPQGPCVPDANSLCLTEGRFRVEVEWEDFDHVVGPGFAEPLTGDSGYFWFFGPDNIELVIKVLDACDSFDHFWIFSGGLTNVGTVLTVTDELTGESRVYRNELGERFQPITDTAAFATCAAGRPSASSTSTPSWSVEPWIAPKVNTCTPSSTGLCLNQGRFLVEALWQAPDGTSGSGQAVQLTDDAGYFWFFSANNVEVVTKVLDACGLPLYENFWVFAAGLTDVEVTLRVTDTVSGQVRDYFNPAGTAFLPIQDTDAFETCNP